MPRSAAPSLPGCAPHLPPRAAPPAYIERRAAPLRRAQIRLPPRCTLPRGGPQRHARAVQLRRRADHGLERGGRQPEAGYGCGTLRRPDCLLQHASSPPACQWTLRLLCPGAAVPEPNLDTHVFCRVVRDIGNIEIERRALGGSSFPSPEASRGAALRGRALRRRPLRLAETPWTS